MMIRKSLSYLRLMGMCLGIAIVGSIAAGCSSAKLIEGKKVQAGVMVEENENIVDKNVQSIKHVLKTEFTSPKQEYNKILHNPENFTIIEGKKILKASYGSELHNYVEGLYKPYFTKTGFSSFFVTSAFNYTLKSKDIKINVKDMEIEKTDKNHNYHFVVSVNYKKGDHATKKYQIKGIATLPEEGKIAQITYKDDGGLLKNIKKNS